MILVPKYLSALVLISALLSACTMHHDEASAGAGLRKSRMSTKPYQATYSAPGNFAYQTEHFYSNGAGRFRIELSGQGPTVVNVLDLKSNETTAWAEGTNKFIRRPSQPTDPLVLRVHMNQMPITSDAQSLGARTISGHKCHGWRMMGTEVWFDDDYGCPVVATAGGITSTLTEFTAREPDPSVFQPPPGYEPASTGQPVSHRRLNRSRMFSDIQRHMR